MYFTALGKGRTKRRLNARTVGRMWKIRIIRAAKSGSSDQGGRTVMFNYICCICPRCGREMFEVFVGDEVRRVRCIACGDIYSEVEYELKDGDVPVKRRRVRWLVGQKNAEMLEVLKEVSDYFAHKCRSDYPFSLCEGRRCDIYPVQRKVRQVLLKVGQ